MKYLFWITIVTLALSLMSLSVFGQTPKKMITNSFDYDKAWREVDSLMNLSQLINVEQLVEKIYTQARANGDSDQLIKNKNLNSQIALQDYRLEKGKFDNIVSIEMFEAVGEKYWNDYRSIA